MTKPEASDTPSRPLQPGHWLSALLHHPSALLLVFDEQDQAIFVSENAQRLLGVTAEQFTGKDFVRRLRASDRPCLEQAFRDVNRGQDTVVTIDCTLKDHQAKDRPVEGLLAGFRDPNGRPQIVVHLQSPPRSSTRDTVTELPNRSYLDRQLARRLKDCSTGQEKPFAVVLLRLDRHEQVEAGYGQSVANSLLRSAADRLQTSTDPNTLVATVRGATFAVVLTDIADPQMAERIAVDLQYVLEQPLLVPSREKPAVEHEFHTTVSVGIVQGPGPYQNVEKLLRGGAAALQSALREGPGAVVTYVPEMFEEAEDRLHLESELRRALDQSTLDVYYQPIVELGTGRIAGFEALLRWIHPERGFVSPGIIIPMAVECGLIERLGYWVLEKACHQLANWTRSHPAAHRLTISVNLAPEQLRAQNLVRHVDRILQESGLHARQLTLEVTESSIINRPEAAAAQLALLRTRAVGLALDDFGTGYSSLSYLHRFPFTTLKIDRSFVSVVESPEDASKPAQLIQTIVSLGRGQGLKVVAEGIETQEQLDFLVQAGCGLGQGYLFSKAVPASEAIGMVTELHAIG